MTEKRCVVQQWSGLSLLSVLFGSLLFCLLCLSVAPVHAQTYYYYGDHTIETIQFRRHSWREYKRSRPLGNSADKDLMPLTQLKGNESLLPIIRDLKSMGITVRIKYRWVYLSGVVASMHEKVLAATIADNIVGVRRVINSIKIDPAFVPSQSFNPPG